MYQIRYRYLHSKLGRWISKDPIGETDGSNLFSITRNDPTNRNDATGLFSLLNPAFIGSGRLSIENVLRFLPPTLQQRFQWLQWILDENKSSRDNTRELGAIDSAVWWLVGNGMPYHVSFSSYDPFWGPSEFSGWEAAIADICSICGSESHWESSRGRDIYREGFFVAGLIGGPGNIMVEISGNLKSNPNQTWAGCGWEFDGKVEILKDRFDFDPTWDIFDTHRTQEGELVTILTRLFQLTTGIGKDYDIEFVGSRKVTAKGTCPK